MNMEGNMKLRAIAVAAAVAVTTALMVAPPAHAGADRILVYGPSLTNDKPLNEADLARNMGYDVRVASAERWASLTTDDFAGYQAIIVGDPNCGYAYGDEDYLAPVLANRDTWSAAVNGPIILAGLDPMYHQRKIGAVAFTNNAIIYAASGSSTGLYFSLSCYFGDTGGTTMKVFKYFGDFSGGYVHGNCDALRISRPDHPSMAGLTSDSLSNWHCSSHEQFDTYPGDFVKVVGTRSTHSAIVIVRDEVLV